MINELKLPSPLQKIEHPLLQDKRIELFMKRDDLIHPHISGNKWRKLKYNIQEAKRLNCSEIVTFGGAFSNHISATAAAGKLYGIKTTGIIRGDEVKNTTLDFAYNCGMKLRFVSRKAYKEFSSKTELVKEHIGQFVIPEGGENAFGVKGCEDIVHEIKIDFDTIICPCGTGTTLTGIINAISNHQKAIGISVLKGEDLLTKKIKKAVQNSNWEINNNYHLGGYAKHSGQLVDFLLDFTRQTSVILDPIYTGKMMFAVLDLVQQGYFQKGQRIIAVHTGGLQGIDGFNIRYGTALPVVKRQ